MGVVLYCVFIIAAPDLSAMKLERCDRSIYSATEGFLSHWG